MPEEEKEVFVIDNDDKADWAIRKIKEAEDECSRLMSLIVHEHERLEQKEKELTEKLERDTSYLKHLLLEYMATVKTKATKTQETYQLLSGKLVKKFPTTDYKKDDERLLEWAKESAPEFVKVKESVDWAEMKKHVAIAGDGRVAIDGEIVDCIRAEEKPGRLDIKFE